MSSSLPWKTAKVSATKPKSVRKLKKTNIVDSRINFLRDNQEWDDDWVTIRSYKNAGTAGAMRSVIAKKHYDFEFISRGKVVWCKKKENF